MIRQKLAAIDRTDEIERERSRKDETLFHNEGTVHKRGGFACFYPDCVATISSMSHNVMALLFRSREGKMWLQSSQNSEAQADVNFSLSIHPIRSFSSSVSLVWVLAIAIPLFDLWIPLKISCLNATPIICCLYTVLCSEVWQSPQLPRSKARLPWLLVLREASAEELRCNWDKLVRIFAYNSHLFTSSMFFPQTFSSYTLA